MQIQHLGGRDDFSTASIRGATGGQVKVLLDGVSLTRASTSVVNLADLPMKSIERIEIYRGFAPVRYGSSGAASVDQHRHAKSAPGPRSMMRCRTDPSTPRDVRVGGHVGEKTSTSASLSYRASDGDFRVPRTARPGDPSDDQDNPRASTTTRNRWI